MSTASPSRPASSRPAPTRTRPSSPPARGGGIDPFRVIRRHMLGLIAATIFGVGLGVGAFYVLNTNYALYSSQVLFEVKPGVQNPGEVATQRAMKDEDIARLAGTQLVLLTSRQVLEDALSDADVQRKTKWFQTTFMEGGTPLIEDAIDELIDDLKTGVVRGTELFEVRWSAHDPADVPKVLNAVARAYMKKRNELDAEQYNENRELFKTQLDETERAIRDLEVKKQDHVRTAGLEGSDPRTHEYALSVQALTEQITDAELAASRVASRLLQTSAKLEGTLEPSSDDILEAEQDPSVLNHTASIQALKVELRVRREKYHTDHPSVRDLEMRLRAAEGEKEARIDEVIRRNLNARLKLFMNERESLLNTIEALQEDREEASDSLTEVTAQHATLDALDSQMTQLEEERQRYNELIKETQLMRLRSDSDRVAVAQLAQTPREKSFPKVAIIVPLVTLLVVGLTLGVFFLRELLDQRVKAAADLAVLPGARVLGVIPDLEDDPTKCKSAELVLRKFPSSVLAESYRQTINPLIKSIDLAGHQTLVLIGGQPGSGTTTAISNLAVAFAATGRRVVVVDANFRRPRLASVFGLEDDRPGLGDLLVGSAEMDDAIGQSEDDVDVISAGAPSSRIIERLNTQKMNSIVAELRGRYDLIIFDVPPAVAAGDAMVMANKLDSAVLVVRANQEERGLVARLISQLGDSSCDLLGIVLNRPRGTAGGYFKKNYATMADYANKAG